MYIVKMACVPFVYIEYFVQCASAGRHDDHCCPLNTLFTIYIDQQVQIITKRDFTDYAQNTQAYNFVSFMCYNNITKHLPIII